MEKQFGMTHIRLTVLCNSRFVGPVFFGIAMKIDLLRSYRQETQKAYVTFTLN